MGLFSSKVSDQDYTDALALVKQSDREPVNPKKLKDAYYRIEKYEDARDYELLTEDERKIYDNLKKYRDIISPFVSMARTAMPDEAKKIIPENLVSLGFRHLIRFMINPESLMDMLNKQVDELADSFGIPSAHMAIMVSKPNGDAMFQIMVFNAPSNTWIPLDFDIRATLRNKSFKPAVAGEFKTKVITAYKSA
jgi:hypothetical protein